MSLIIIRDTREQRGWNFANIIPRPQAEVAKSLIELFGAVGRGRDRFERELERLAKMKFGAVVIEADLHIIAARPPAVPNYPPRL